MARELDFGGSRMHRDGAGKQSALKPDRKDVQRYLATQAASDVQLTLNCEMFVQKERMGCGVVGGGAL